MNAAKIIGVLLGGVTLVFVVTEPAAAAAVVTTVLGGLRDGADAFITFLRNLFS